MTKNTNAILDPNTVENGCRQREDPSSRDDDDAAVLAVRNLVFDLCTQHGGGHGGSALGMAAIGVALWKYVMRYNPADPSWFDRDRFVLSNGHASMFLYVMNHLVGYDAWTMDELKGYGSAKLNGFHTLSHAHPEIQCPGVEVTTGPLGQGIANAVGMAMASKNLAANFNKPGHDIVQATIWCTTGDGCLMEGVALEAISLAGHLKLDNLVLIYDNNGITCDGPLSWINTEDVGAKLRAQNWEVLTVQNGSHDVSAIVSALKFAKSFSGKPVFVDISTEIGVSAASAGTHKAHHGTFDAESIARSKRLAGLHPDATHVVPEGPLAFFRERRAHGIRLQGEWDQLLSRYTQQYPTEAAALAARQTHDIGAGLALLAELDSTQFAGKATREANGHILAQLWDAVPSLCGGGADLANSNMLRYAEEDVFMPSTGHKGRYLRHGIREHAMASIANGMAAYHPGCFVPVTATFFMFYLYAAPGVRMGALSNLQVIHIATHDSIRTSPRPLFLSTQLNMPPTYKHSLTLPPEEGQNGPTHQPVSLDSLYRALPNLHYHRPTDTEELLGAWAHALSSHTTPSMLSLARDAVAAVPGTSRTKAQRGAYVLFAPDAAPALTLASCGPVLPAVLAAAKSLTSDFALPTRVVSAPCLDLFAQQPRSYQSSVFPRDGSPVVSIEEYVPTVWARYASASIGMAGFGYSASGAENMRRFGFDEAGIVGRVRGYLADLEREGMGAWVGGWRML